MADRLISANHRVLGWCDGKYSSLQKKSANVPHAVRGPVRAQRLTRPPLPRREAYGSGSNGLRGVVRSAKALTVGRIERITAVTPLDYVICKHAMPRRSLRTPLTSLNSFATISRSLQNCLPPTLVRFGQQFWICLLRWRSYRARINDAQADLHRFDFRHLTFGHSWRTGPESVSARLGVRAGPGGDTFTLR